MKTTLKIIPNILTFSRLILSPLSMYFVFVYPNAQLFIIYLLIIHITDVMDGYFARKFDAISDFGRKLDAYADYVIALCGMTGIWVFLSTELTTNLPLLYTILGSIIIPASISIVRIGYFPQLHLNTNKLAWGIAIVFILTSIFIDFFPLLYLTTTIFFVIAAIDRTIFYLLFRDIEDMKILNSWELIAKIRDSGKKMSVNDVQL